MLIILSVKSLYIIKDFIVFVYVQKIAHHTKIFIRATYSNIENKAISSSICK